MSRQNEQVRVGIAWFDRDQWLRLTKVVPNRSDLDDTFEQWERSAKKALRNFARLGQQVEKVPIRIDDLLAWCTLRGVAPDSKARSQFVSEIIKKKYETQS